MSSPLPHVHTEARFLEECEKEEDERERESPSITVRPVTREEGKKVGELNSRNTYVTRCLSSLSSLFSLLSLSLFLSQRLTFANMVAASAPADVCRLVKRNT